MTKTRYTMPPRPMGIENECSGYDWRSTNYDDRVENPVTAEIIAANRFPAHSLPNGSGLFEDMEHVEIATSECLTPRALALQEKANEHILDCLARFVSERNGHPVAILKDNISSAERLLIDPQGDSWANHESYEVSANVEPLNESGLLAQALTGYLVSRLPFVGVGKVQNTPDGPVYCIGQRADLVSFVHHHTALDLGLPLILARNDDEDLRPEGRFRIQLAAGDSLRSSTAMWMRAGVLDVMLTMIEQGAPEFPIVEFSNPVDAVNYYNRDPDGKVWARTKSHGGLTVFEAQEIYWRGATAWADRVNLDPVQREPIDFWGRMIELGKVSTKGLTPWFDFAAKRTYIEKLRTDKGLGLLDDKVIAADVAWQNLNPRSSTFDVMRRRFPTLEMFSTNEITTAMTTPPAGRGEWRTAGLRAIADAGYTPLGYGRLTWDALSYSVPGQSRTINLWVRDARGPTDGAFVDGDCESPLNTYHELLAAGRKARVRSSGHQPRPYELDSPYLRDHFADYGPSLDVRRRSKSLLPRGPELSMWSR